MREKKKALIISFATTTAALKMEQFSIANGISGRLIPIPREITAGCGLAWKTLPQEQETLTELLTKEKIAWEEMHVLDL